MHDASGKIHHKSNTLVLVIVGLGIVTMGVGAYVALKRRSAASGLIGTPSAMEGGVARWCEVRRSWAKEVDGLAADIALKSIRSEDQDERLALERRRDGLCAQYARKVRDLGLDDSRVVGVEEALVREGKVRANVSVEINNVLTRLAAANLQDNRYGSALERMQVLQKARGELHGRIKQRIRTGRAAADKEVEQSLHAIEGCSGIYRGPLTDKGTSSTPYVSWDELDLHRKRALQAFDDRIRDLEPKEQFANQVYHAMLRHYRQTLRNCYRKTKRLNPKISNELELQVRLKRSGQVRSLGIRAMAVGDNRLLSCLLDTAATWRLPPPVRGGEVVVVALDLSAM